MSRRAIACAVMALILAAFMLQACNDTPTQQVDYCDMQPKPLICP